MWRSKADRYDRIVSNRLVKFTLPLLGLSSAPKPTLLPGHSNSKAGWSPATHLADAEGIRACAAARRREPCSVASEDVRVW